MFKLFELYKNFYFYPSEKELLCWFLWLLFVKIVTLYSPSVIIWVNVAEWILQ